MKILDVLELAIPGVKVIRAAKFRDARGYFMETFRRSDLDRPGLLPGFEAVQANSSFSRAGTVRGLHFQWNPFMGKLVRTVHGHMVDLVVDVRKGSPTFGCVVAHDMPEHEAFADLIWVPPGFAHGNLFPRDSYIEYLCTGEYNGDCEAGISPLAGDLDWSLAPPELARRFRETVDAGAILSDRDRDGLTLRAWSEDPRSAVFPYTA